MQAPNSEVKRAWVREISRILWHQAIRNRGELSGHLCGTIKPSGTEVLSVTAFWLLVYSVDH